MPQHLFSNGHGQMQDDFGNMIFLSNSAWRNAWILWYEEDFTYELEMKEEAESDAKSWAECDDIPYYPGKGTAQ